MCLAHFVRKHTLYISEEDKAIQGIFAKLHHTSFIKPLLPGDRVEIRTQLIECDDWFGLTGSQIVKGDTVCAVGILEAYFNE